MGQGERPTGRVDGRPVYEGEVLDVHLDRVRFPDGSEGELEIIRHPGAAAVLPLRRRTDGRGTTVLAVMLRQYRYAAGGPVWEVPAGKLEGDETPEACARRELQEEAGYRAGTLRALTRIYTTPGFTDEEIHLFLATGLEPVERRPEESEFIEVHELPVERALRMVREGRIHDAKTVCTLLYAHAFGAMRIGAVDENV